MPRAKLLYIFLAVLAIVYCAIEAQGQGDLFIYLSASADLANHEDIFVKTYVDGYHYYYSVIFAILLKPLTYLPYYWVKFAWLLLNCFFVFTLFKKVFSLQILNGLDQKQRNFFYAGTILFSARFIHENIHASQVTIMMLFMMVVGLQWILKEKWLQGAILLAFCINIKLLGIILLPYLFWRGYLKALITTIGVYVLLLVLPSLIIGHQYNMALLNSWLHLINPANSQHVLDVDERSFHSLTTLLSTLLVKNVPDYYALNIKRNIADVSLSTLSMIITITRLCFVAFTLFYLRTFPFKKATSTLHSYFELCYLFALIPLIFPHQQHYAFLFVAPAFAISLFIILKEGHSWSATKRNFIWGIIIIVFLCAALKMLLGTFNNYYEHFKILTWGALILLGLQAYLFHKLNKESNERTNL
ncbi:MAG: glycosyltransferase family 87 protein [Sphingobacteriaceae bacterium]